MEGPPIDRYADRNDFDRLVHRHRRELLSYCYKILGSIDDAEDALQETLLKAWRSIDTYRGEGSVRAWLYGIATNTCLTEAKRRARRRSLPSELYAKSEEVAAIPDPVSDPIWLDPAPSAYCADPSERFELREKTKIAFLLLYQLLNPQQRSILILRDILAFSARETAGILGLSTSSVNSSLLRARKRVEREIQRYPADTVDLAERNGAVESLVESFMRVWERSDVAGLVSLMTEDSIVSMPPLPIWLRGRTAIESFLTRHVFSKRTRLVRTDANGQLAFAGYRLDGERYVPHTLLVLSIAAGAENARITSMISFLNPRLFSPFGLPASLGP